MDKLTINSETPQFGINKAFFDDMLEKFSLEELVYRRLQPLFHRLELDRVEHFYQLVISQVERALLRLALEKSRGNQSLAASHLGINRNTLRQKMKKLAIPASTGKLH